MLIKKIILTNLCMIMFLYASSVIASQKDAPVSLVGKTIKTSITQGTGVFHSGIDKIRYDKFINAHEFISNQIGKNDNEIAEYRYLKQDKDTAMLIISHHSGKYKNLTYKSILNFKTSRFQITGISSHDTAKGWFELN